MSAVDLAKGGVIKGPGTKDDDTVMLRRSCYIPARLVREYGGMLLDELNRRERMRRPD